MIQLVYMKQGSTQEIIWDYIADKYAKENHVKNICEESVSNVIKDLVNEYSSNDSKKISLIDYGCGPGRYFEIFGNSGIDANFFGIDISRRMIEIARETYPDAQYTVGDASTTEVAGLSTKADVAIAMMLFQNIDDNTFESMTAMISRQLIDGGKLVLLLPNPDETSKFNRYIPNRNKFKWEENVETDFYFRSTDYYLQAFRKYGFSHVETMHPTIKESQIVTFDPVKDSDMIESMLLKSFIIITLMKNER